jgi:hypothetical protein
MVPQGDACKAIKGARSDRSDRTIDLVLGF